MALRLRSKTGKPGSSSKAALQTELLNDLELPADGEHFGALLVANGAVTSEQLSDALEKQKASGLRLGEQLLQQRLVSEGVVAKTLGQQYSLDLIDLTTYDVDNDASAIVGEEIARTLGILPISVGDDEAFIVVSDPTDPRVVRALQSLPVARARVGVAGKSQISNAINLAYRAIGEVNEFVDKFASSDQARIATAAAENAHALEIQDDAPVIQVVNRIVTQALRDRASDVHIEPMDENVRIRFRIDGALKEVLRLPTTMGPALISRIKIMAEMNIVERRRPQDGQFQTVVDGVTLDVRVSTTSTIFGEKAVLRLLDKSRAMFNLADLGMPEHTSKIYSKMVRAPFGMVVVCGPTGSGKTTTLYATLTEIANEEINVTTVEDPVEYIFPGINQIQTNEQAGISFAAGLKSILRQDPDVILVGEMRDVETARIAVQSALTGHFVLSTVHAVDTVSALYRLIDMGIEPFLVASSMSGVLAQRLVRKNCTACLVEYEPTPDQLSFYNESAHRTEKTHFVKGAGCTYCAHTGYRERIGVYELLSINDDVRRVLVEGGTPDDLRKAAAANGLRSLRDEALDLVANDVTTIAEVIRSVYTTS
jgi:type IV pilus assembly protein PilB